MAVVGVAATASSAQAQGRRFDIGFQAKALHDTNVARSNSVLALQRGITPEDNVYTPALTMDIFLPVGRQSVYLNGSVGYQIYDKNSQLNSERLDLLTGINTRVGPCSGGINGQFSRAQSDLQQLSIVSPENILETRRVGASINCGRSVGLSATVSGGYSETDNSNPIQHETNYQQNNIIGSLVYQRPTFGVATVFVNYSKIEYPNRSLLTAANSGYESTGVGVSFERRLGSRLKGKVTVAQTSVEPLNAIPGFPAKFDSTTYNGDISYRPTARLEAVLTYDRSVSPSLSVTRLYDVTESGRLELRYQIGTRITATAGYQVSDVDTQSVTTPNPNDLTNAHTELEFGSLTFRQSRRLNFRLDVSQEDRNTNTPRLDYKSTRVGLTTNVAF